MICKFVRVQMAADPSLTWEDFTLAKMDLKSAFNLLSFDPHHVRYLAVALTDALTLLSLVGCFGYTNLPAFFDHIPKVLLRLLRPLIKAAADMFVDDFMAITLKRDWLEVHDTVKTVCQNLLGSKAISDDKTQTGTVLDFIGYEIDLGRQRVCIAHHCFLKAVFFVFRGGYRTARLVTSAPTVRVIGVTVQRDLPSDASVHGSHLALYTRDHIHICQSRSHSDGEALDLAVAVHPLPAPIGPSGSEPVPAVV
jgi:hypothetical protein